MASLSHRKSKKQVRLRVGDRVRFRFADRWLVGTIIEDRGLLAVGRKRLLRIRVQRPREDDLVTEVPVDKLRVA